MSKQVFIGLFTEGNTDNRFLQSVVKRTFDETAFDAVGDFEIAVQPITIQKAGLSFTQQIIEAAKEGNKKYGITVLCIHKDADAKTDTAVFKNSLIPALQELSFQKENEHCKVVAFIVPVHMIEAWLLADKELFKKEIGSAKTDLQLKIDKHPETVADPKGMIKEAIRIAREDMVKRRRKDLTISEIYMPLGQKISIEKLRQLPSYIKFAASAKEAFRQLNYLN